MLSFKTLLSLLLFSFSISSIAHAEIPSPAARQQAHESFARDFAQTVLAIIQDTKKSYTDRKDILRHAFANSVDMDWIARFVLGKSWQGANDTQRDRYTALYKQFLTETYVANFAEKPERRIRDIKILNVGVADNEGNESDFTVKTLMMLADGENLHVDYLVSERDKSYSVRDFAIENVSLIATHRSEFSGLAAGGGIDQVIASLEHRLAQPITVSMN